MVFASSFLSGPHGEHGRGPGVCRAPAGVVCHLLSVERLRGPCPPSSSLLEQLLPHLAQHVKGASVKTCLHFTTTKSGVAVRKVPRALH